MTNEEKAKEIVLKVFEDGFYHFNSISQRKRFEKSLIEFAKWKEQQIIEKAVKWIDDNEPFYRKYDESGYYNEKNQYLIRDFKKAMEE